MRRMIVLAALVVAAVALFVVGRGSGPEPLRLTTAGAHYTATVLIGRPTTGRISVEVRVTSGDADGAALSAVMPDMGHAMPELVAGEPEPGRFVAEGELFAMTGVWDLSIRLTGPAGEETLTGKALITGG
ncbi:hypothetical protein [Nonomuraea sp. LPB2021202275-12-8]|uniref:hypothetical protein n=1 Tax=Nonomuraea sp. LPB2021202275-12-8 TaxID=3120159 RepID=UPI00300D40CC